MPTLNFAFLLTSGNVRALLRVIREGESSQNETAYRLRYHPTIYPCYFDGDVHPRIKEPLKDGSGRFSTAAGAYQFTASTWDDVNAQYGLADDMSPYSQDCHAIALIHMVGALDLIIDGLWQRAVVLCSQRWASLPGSTLEDGGTKMSWDRVRRVYEQYGGFGPSPATSDSAPRGPYGDEQEPAPIEDRSINLNEEAQTNMGPALFIPLLTSLAEVFSPLLRSKLTQALDKQVKDPAMSQQMATQIMDIVKQAASQSGLVPQSTPAPTPTPAAAAPPPEAPLVYVPGVRNDIDPVVAVGLVKSSPLLAQQVEQSLIQYLEQLAPVFDRVEKLEQMAWKASEDSMNAASARAVSEQDGGQDKLLTWAILIIAGTVLLALAISLGLLIYYDRPYGEILALFAAGVGSVWAKFGTRYDYRYGSSRGSQAKDVVINQLTKR